MLHIATLIKMISQAELSLEAERSKLAKNLLFEPYSLFQRLDQQEFGCLDCQDLADFLQATDIVCDRNELAYLFKKLDADRDGRISFSDYQSYILPKMDDFTKEVLCQRDSYRLNVIPVEVEFQFSDVLRQEIKNYRTLILHKQCLMNQVNLVQSLQLSDLFRLGYLKKENLLKFMNDQNIPLEQYELQAFYNTVHHISRITFNNFIEALYLMEPIEQQQQQQKQQQLQTTDRNISKKKLCGFHRVTKSQYPYFEYPYFERKSSIFTVKNVHRKKNEEQPFQTQETYCIYGNANYKQNIQYPTFEQFLR